MRCCCCAPSVSRPGPAGCWHLHGCSVGQRCRTCWLSKVLLGEGLLQREGQADGGINETAAEAYDRTGGVSSAYICTHQVKGAALLLRSIAAPPSLLLPLLLLLSRLFLLPPTGSPCCCCVCPVCALCVASGREMLMLGHSEGQRITLAAVAVLNLHRCEQQHPASSQQQLQKLHSDSLSLLHQHQHQSTTDF